MIQNQLKPFTVQVKPVAQILAPAAKALSQATPPLARSIGVLNTLFDTLAYQPKTGEQGYLFWGSWLGHVADLPDQPAGRPGTDRERHVHGLLR